MHAHNTTHSYSNVFLLQAGMVGLLKPGDSVNYTEEVHLYYLLIDSISVIVDIR